MDGIAELFVRFAGRDQTLIGEKIDEQLADGIDPGLVVAAAVGVHRIAKQGDHGVLLRGEPLRDLGFVWCDLGHMQGSGRRHVVSMECGPLDGLSPNTLPLTGRVGRRALRAPSRVGCL